MDLHLVYAVIKVSILSQTMPAALTSRLVTDRRNLTALKSLKWTQQMRQIFVMTKFVP